MWVLDNPVSLKGKLYARGWQLGDTIVEYTPDNDQWTALPPPPVSNFATATVKDQLLVVGGRDKSTNKTCTTVLTFDDHSEQWVESYCAMPTAVVQPVAIEYQDHLIIAGGDNSNDDRIPDVNILDTFNNKWKTAQPLPSTASYHGVIVEDTMYLVGWDNQTVLRALAPAIISGAKSGVWETVIKCSVLLVISCHYWQHPLDRWGYRP